MPALTLFILQRLNTLLNNMEHMTHTSMELKNENFKLVSYVEEAIRKMEQLSSQMGTMPQDLTLPSKFVCLLACFFCFGFGFFFLNF